MLSEEIDNSTVFNGTYSCNLNELLDVSYVIPLDIFLVECLYLPTVSLFIFAYFWSSLSSMIPTYHRTPTHVSL